MHILANHRNSCKARYSIDSKTTCLILLTFNCYIFHVDRFHIVQTGSGKQLVRFLVFMIYV